MKENRFDMIRKLAKITFRKPEIWVFMVSFLFFISLAIVYCLYIDTTVRPEARGYDSFWYVYLIQNRSITFWHFRHPLFVQFFKPYYWMLAELGLASYQFCYILISVVAMSFSNLLVYKILEKEKLSCLNALVVVFLFSSLAHVLLLSTQLETFTLTMLFSLLSIYLIQRKRDDTITDNVLFAFLTGVTSTNSAKFFLMNLSCATSAKQYIVKCLKSIWLFVLLMLVPLIGLCRRIIAEGLHLRILIGDTLNYTTTDGDRIRMFINSFICDPICFHDANVIYDNSHGDLGDYSSFLYYIPVLIILFVVCCGIFRNRKNHIVQMAVMCFIVDFFFTQILGYGIDQPWISCGGWLFVIPICYGLSLTNTKNKWIKTTMMSVTIIISIFLMAHNLWTLYSSLLCWS